ncbi:MAG: GNAT family N-acetyltransferase [Candidatus Hydrogenedentes bacterium]|nr:GNAT family N-acetyltransferase [Candidatus Hydrogenedentota bacterium]
MIVKEYSVIRTVEYKDVDCLYKFYNGDKVYGSLLDQKREPVYPTLSELEELLQNKDVVNSFYVVEDKDSNKIGLVGLKGINQEVLFGEVIILFDDGIFKSSLPIVSEALDFIEEKAFRRMHLKKVLSLCLDSETSLMEFLSSRSYKFEGELREVLYTKGKWHNLQTWAKYNDRI